jgi:hypothetical protein
MVGPPLVRNGLVVVIRLGRVSPVHDPDQRPGCPYHAGRARRAQGGMGQWAWPRVAAVYVIVVTPGIIAFAFAQRLFFKGLMEGVLKA